MASRKMILMNLFSGQPWRNRLREQTYGHGGRERGRGEMYGEHMVICEIDSQWEFI